MPTKIIDLCSVSGDDHELLSNGDDDEVLLAVFQQFGLDFFGVSVQL